MTTTEQILRDAAQTGKYPADTTARDLAKVKDNQGWGALHLAAWSGYYPPGTTAQNLANTKNPKGLSALHEAARFGHYPPDTTAQDLINTKNIDGYTALHTAARHGQLPPDTTTALLKTTKDNEGNSAWDGLCSYLQKHPTHVLELPPYLFEKNSSLATTTIQAAIKNDSSLQSKAAIWLGNILAVAQHDRITPTH